MHKVSLIQKLLTPLLSQIKCNTDSTRGAVLLSGDGYTPLKSISYLITILENRKGGFGFFNLTSNLTVFGGFITGV